MSTYSNFGYNRIAITVTLRVSTSMSRVTKFYVGNWHAHVTVNVITEIYKELSVNWQSNYKSKKCFKQKS